MTKQEKLITRAIFILLLLKLSSDERRCIKLNQTVVQQLRGSICHYLVFVPLKAQSPGLIVTTKLAGLLQQKPMSIWVSATWGR